MEKNRIFSQLPKLFALLVVVDLAQLFCIGGTWFGVWYTSDLNARYAIAERLDIEPSWESLEKYIETQFFVGMTRTEVVKQAEMIGAESISIIFIGEIYCEVYSFSVGPFSSNRGGRWSICYDQNDNVISVEKVLSA